MWTVSNGSVSAPTIMSIILESPIRAPQRCVSDAYAARLMLSAPPATAASVSPSRMYCDAETIACMPLPHRRFTVNAPVSCGRPPFTQARREMYMSFGSVWITLPITHWPTSFGSIFARLDRFLDDARGEVARRDVLEAAAVIADGGAHSTQDDDFALLTHDPTSAERDVNYPRIRILRTARLTAIQ